jgi:hypothetical protein
MKDCFGHLGKENFLVTSFQIKFSNGLFLEFDENFDLKSFEKLEFIVKI